jgi:alpha-beta hydrolase superfamily lysophospholipase
MTPLFFGESSRRLFGVYTPAHARGGKARGVVLCQPWGTEYLRAHRSVCQLGRLLAEAGFHVLRFDYFGTGDSAGDAGDGELAGWQADVETAIDELKDTAGLQRVSLVGLRLGAVLAARVAPARRRDIDAVVLWDPVVQGDEHLAELQTLDAAVARERSLKVNPGEVLGFPLSARLAGELQAIDLVQHLAGLPSRAFMVACATSPGHEAVSAALQAARPGVPAAEHIPSLPAWLEDQHSGAGAVPVKQLQRIVEWMA